MAVKVDACWALSFLADGQEKQIQVKPSQISNTQKHTCTTSSLALLKAVTALK